VSEELREGAREVDVPVAASSVAAASSAAFALAGGITTTAAAAGFGVVFEIEVLGGRHGVIARGESWVWKYYFVRR
jgi:hypothetical protein